MNPLINKFKCSIKKSPDLYLWLFIFIMISIISLMIQLLILPVIFPSWHAFDGMLANADTSTFHREAVEIAHSIREEGWAVWELRPKGWMPVGIASAIYALTLPKPWVLIPLNAAVHATTILIVFKILLFFTTSRKIAFIAAMPFAFFPSAALWYAQIHRDGYNLLGVVLFVFGLLYILSSSKNKNYSKKVIEGFLIMFSGMFVVWLVRPHQVIILQYTLVLIFILIIAILFFRVLHKKNRWKPALLQVVTFVLLIGLMSPFTQTSGASKYQTEDSSQAGDEQEEQYKWEKIEWLPQTIDNYLYSIAYLRAVRFPGRYGEPASAIDYDRPLHSGYDFILYLPRALQISFFAPFPNTWLGEGSHEATTAFRRIIIIEMLLIYMVAPFLFYALWFWRKRIELWVLYMFCTIVILPIVYGVPSVGTIYRYRYGYLMLMVAVGIVVFFELLIGYRKSRQLKHEKLQNRGE